MVKKSLPQADNETCEKLRRHIRILVDLARAASTRQEPERFLEIAAKHVARAIEVDNVKILRYRRKTSDFIFAAGEGWKEGVVGAATMSATFQSVAGRAFHTAEPIVVPDIEDVHDFLIEPIMREHGIVAMSNVPILVNGSAWGVLEVDNKTRRDFGQDTTEFLTAAAAMIGPALQEQSPERPDSEAIAAAIRQAQERDILLREMQHRVKNNFQLILGSVAVQRRRFDAQDVRRALDHVTNRIVAVSLAHDQLAPDQSDIVDFAGYLRALCNSIESQVDGIAIELQTDELELGIDRGMPLGLIVNECATNSVKHAFDDDGGRITVALRTGVGRGEAELTIADNGKGIKSDATRGSGLKLIAALARQVGGSLDQTSSKDGTTTRIIFPVL